MNANELIDRTVKLLDESREWYLTVNPYLTDEESDEFAKDYQYYESLLSILSCTRIRVTADEPPEYEDTSESKNGRWDVLAYNNRDGEWIAYDYVGVCLNPKTYTHWAQLPEVTE